MATIEPSRPGDLEAIARISEAVFEPYGDYGAILPKFFTSQGVTTYVARIGGELVGFVMLGFLPWSGGAEKGDPWMADLLAIAVDPRRQRQGIGQQLMEQALLLVGEMSEWRDVREIQLTCAASNLDGLRFFSRLGFEVINPNEGAYSGGQPALRLARTLAGITPP